MFPLTISIRGYEPLAKVSADYFPPPQNKFDLKVNDDSYFTLVKEESDFDPSLVELFKCDSLRLNGIEAHRGTMPWIIDEVEEMINKVYRG